MKAYHRRTESHKYQPERFRVDYCFAEELCCAVYFVDGVEVSEAEALATCTLTSALDYVAISPGYACAQLPTGLSRLAPPWAHDGAALQYPQALKGEIVNVQAGHTRRRGE